MNIQAPGQAEEASFDLTPMIDVVLLLIIFFMMTSQFSRTDQAQLNLPVERGDGSTHPGDNAIVIDLDARGRVSVAGNPEDIETLALRIGSEATASGIKPETLDIVIRADKDAAAADLSRVCIALARLGMRTVRLATNSDQAVADQAAAIVAPAVSGGSR